MEKIELTPHTHYSVSNLKALYELLNPNSYLSSFLNETQFDNVKLYRLLISKSHEKKYDSHIKNLIRSIRTLLYDAPHQELGLWVTETTPELKAICQWRLTIGH